LARRNIIILVVLAALLAASGITGYQAWQEYQQPAIDAGSSGGCELCSFLKKDLAEQERLRKQKSEQQSEPTD
jgi:predicted negative regulator of RcsB-dependent stress response|tara:strand:- start:359 stop:577 length:219 start_codon:yes stop_codon:yes gene_type:complete